MQIISRQDAIRQNLKYYFTGVPCPYGHICKRKVHNCTCYICAQTARTIREAQENGKYRSGDKLRTAIRDQLGNKCSKCGFADYRALQIDHINGGGSKEIRATDPHTYYKKVLAYLKTHTNTKYQLLCANCNWIKRHTNSECATPKLHP